MKSILFISLMNGDAWGGSEELWYQSALYAARNGYRVGCAFYDWPQKQERIACLRAAGCELYLFSNKGREKRTFLERLQYKITKRKVRRYANALPFGEYDLTVINQGYLEVISHYWKGLHRYVDNYVLLYHGFNENDRIKPKYKPLLKRWVLHARQNLFASERTKTFLERELAITLPHADTLLNPLTFPAPQESTPPPPLQENNYIFVMLAALDARRKAQDNLIKALAAEKWKARNWKVYLYGQGQSETMLKSLIREQGLQDRVLLKGHTSDVKKALNEAHVLLQLTHIDAMPLAVIEAMAMTRPVAVSDVGDMPKWVTDGYNGWVSKNASVDEISLALERCWQNRAQWDEMGNHSFRLFQEKFPAVPEAFFLQQLKKEPVGKRYGEAVQ
ncbi:MAG TPA: glycosyltransferase family 4 protein [Flavisolibacter sp.]|nr:glycosyltransferase family 4 protein [Flavisolibacter sp.]